MPPQDTLRPATYRDIIAAEAKKRRIPAELAFALVEQESSGRINPPDAGMGAHGFFQLMPETAKTLGVDPTDPLQNIQGGLTYLRQQLDASTQGGMSDIGKALALYHGGADLRQHGPKTAAYVQSILGRLQKSSGAPPARGRLQVGQPPAEAVTAPQTPTTPQAGGTQPEPLRFGASNKPSALKLPETWSHWGVRKAKEFGAAVDPRTAEGLRNLGGAAGAIAGTAAVVGTAPVSIPVIGASAATAGAIGAFGGGELMEGANQLLGRTPASTTGMLAAGGEQAAYEYLGQAVMWPFKLAGRTLLASSVGKSASAKLTQVRAATMARLDNALEQARNAGRNLSTTMNEATRRTQRQAAEAARVAGRTASENSRIAAEAAATGRRAARGVARTELRTARQQGEALVGRAPDDVVSRARRSAADVSREAGIAAQVGVQTAEEQAAQRTAGAAAPYESLVGQPPSTERAGQVAYDVLTGPSQEAKDIVGRRVEQVAKAGPPVSLDALKAETDEIFEQLAEPERIFPRSTPEAAAKAESIVVGGRKFDVAKLEQQAAAGDRNSRAILAAHEQVRADLDAAQAAAHQELLKHPAFDVIRRIRNADRTATFHAVHTWKSQLQEALAAKGAYSGAVLKEVDRITKRLVGGLRQSLKGHVPYDEATADYAAIADLYTEGYAQMLRESVELDPSLIIRKITSDNPTTARMFRDVLVTQSAKVGKEAEGQAAWDAVRSAWTHTHVLKGGIDKLEGNLAKLPREFTEVFYGDASGQAIFQNLKTIASAYKTAEQSGLFDLAAAKAAGQAGVEGARVAGEQTVDQALREAGRLRSVASTGMETARTTGRAALEAARARGAAGIEAARSSGKAATEAARQAGATSVETARLTELGVNQRSAESIRGARTALKAGRLPTPDEVAFGTSTVARALDPAQAGADLIRLGGLGLTQIWGILSGLRLLLRSPRGADVLQWAAYAPENTQLLTRLFTWNAKTTEQAASRFTGWSPTGMATSDAARLLGLANFLKGQDQAKKKEKPPAPARAQVGAPPPR